jgi:hypothetical protein
VLVEEVVLARVVVPVVLEPELILLLPQGLITQLPLVVAGLLDQERHLREQLVPKEVMALIQHLALLLLLGVEEAVLVMAVRLPQNGTG